MIDDVSKDINNEWIKLLNHIGEIAPDDLVKIQDMNEKYGVVPKVIADLFEQGYRSGWNSATSIIQEQLEKVER
jgi:hypothetical protein